MKQKEKTHPESNSQRKIRYAVAGLGYITQHAILPAFEHAHPNSQLTALISGDPGKLKLLAPKYGVQITGGYADYDRILASRQVDAVLIALPNDLHCQYTIRALNCGLHVLCEKPMAVTEEDCQAMIDAAQQHQAKLMIAYRLHFEPANLQAIELAGSGQLGAVRIFSSQFTMQINDKENIRLRKNRGGGTLYDIGIYCLNAARYLFRAEPTEVFAFTANNGEERFKQVEEMSTALLRFPGERLASFTVSFGAANVASYQIIGTKGSLRVDPAFPYTQGLVHHLKTNGQSNQIPFPHTDQFAAEIIHFSNAILNNVEPEPSGYEGLADIRVIRALYRSAQLARPIKLPAFERRLRPSKSQELRLPPVHPPQVLIHVKSPQDS